MKFNKNEFGWKEKVNINTNLNNDTFNIKFLPDMNISSKVYVANIVDLEENTTYRVNMNLNKKLSIRYYFSDGTFKSLYSLASKYLLGKVEIYIYRKTDTLIEFDVDNDKYIRYTCNIDEANKTVEITKKALILNTDNKQEYTPTLDYHPATKKYVDDKFVMNENIETIYTIPMSEMQKCNNGTSRYVSNIDFDELFINHEKNIYYANYKDDTLIPVTYDSTYNRFTTGVLDDLGSVDLALGFDLGTHMMYPFNGGMAVVKAYTFTNDLIIKRVPILDVNEVATKKYVDDKTEILPVAHKYVIFEDAVPRLMEDTATYGVSGGINGAYIFDNLQNTDMIVYSAKFNLIISFNDGTEDITKNITVDVDEQTGFSGYEDDYFVALEYNEDTNLIMVSVIKGVQTDNGYNEIPCTVTKATFICILYSGLLKSNVIEDIAYKKITNVPTELQYLTDGRNETLRSKEYYNLYDNSFVWDMNKINERLDENSGVTRNTFSSTYNGKVIKVNQKDSEGIGFGQLVPIKRDKNVAIFVHAEQDVIIKVYNPNTKELIFTMEDIYINSFRYAKYSIPFHKVRDIDNIFIAFTIKDIPTDSFSNNTINDLIVIDESTFLKKKEILTKTNTKEYTPTSDYNPATKKYVDDAIASQPTFSFNDSGELVVTINGITKIFGPKQ